MILVAVGANIQATDGTPPRQSCERAVAAVAALPGLRLVACSRWHVTRPVPAADQPDYVNGVARFAGTPDPAWLLAELHAIEAAAGRRRSVANAARPLDLDIIDLNGICRAAPDPVLPHPRAHQRGFVLLPLLEVAPDWLHPASRQHGADLLAALPG